jgi:tRNA-specific 2-thiouridylase
VLDLSDVFAKRVVKPFARSYAKGETPNPCIECNHHLKFGALFKKARALGADFVATGHYARVSRGGLFRAADPRKDQSYVLYRLTPRELAHVLFPLGEMTKDAVREEARRLKLRVAAKPDSQEICFVPPGKTAEYLKTCGLKGKAFGPGDLRDTSGKRLGTHKGVAYYTRGQREGLGIAVGKPLYVVDLDPKTNTVVVGNADETLSRTFSVEHLSWTLGAPPASRFKALVQIRSRHEPAPCRVNIKGGTARVEAAQPLRAVTPGQAAVFYRGDQVLGGGLISR